MPTILSHAVAAMALVAAFPPQAVPRRLMLVGAACAMLPDVDVIGLRFGIPYGSLLGHRGLTHSLAFALCWASIVCLVVYHRPRPDLHREWVWLYLLLATASHGLLDACTNGGLGVAFFSPFSPARHFYSFTPIAVSPLGARFFSARGWFVLRSEFAWVWLPSLGFAVVAVIVRRMLGRATGASSGTGSDGRIAAP